MTTAVGLRRSALAACAFMGFVSAGALAQVTIQGATCATPPPLHCPDSECSGAMVINQGPVVEMKTRRTVLPRLSVRPEARREGHVHPEPARRRLVRQLAAALLSVARLQGQVPAGDRHAELAGARVVGRRRSVSAEHRRVRGRPVRQGQHQGFLARRAFARRPDVEPHHSHGLLQEQSGWLAQPVGRPARRQSWALRYVRADAGTRRNCAERCTQCFGVGRCRSRVEPEHVRRRRGVVARAARDRLLIYI